MVLVVPLVMMGGEGWRIRNEREGTVLRAVRVVGVMKRWDGRVRVPAWRADMET